MSDLRTRLRLEGDATALVAAADQGKAALDGLSDKAEATGRGMRGAGEGAGAAAEDLNRATDAAEAGKRALEGLEEKADGAGRGLRDTGEGAAAAAEGAERAGGSAESGQRALEGLEEKATDAGRGLRDVGEAGSSAATGVGRAGTAAGDADRTMTPAAASAGKLGQELSDVSGEAPRTAAGLHRTSESAREAGEATDIASVAYRTLAAAMAAIGARELISEIEEAALAEYRLEGSLRASTRAGQDQRQELAFIEQTAERLGISTNVLAADYTALSTATRGTILEGTATRNAYLAAAEAGVAYHRTNEEIGASMTALGRVAGRSRISLSDLTGDLRTLTPDALSTAARAMGVTTAAMTTMLQRGKVATDDFLPKFVGLIRRDVQPALEQALADPVHRASAELSQLQDTVERVEATAGRQFLAGIVNGVANLRGELGSADLARCAEEFGHALGRGAGIAADAAALLVDHLDEVIAAGEALAGAGLVRYLVGQAAALRQTAIAAANTAVAQAEEAAAAEAAAVAAGTHYRAATTLVEALTTAERMEVSMAAAALREAEAHEAAAAAVAAHASASAGLGTAAAAAAAEAEVALAGAQNASAAAAARLTAAELSAAQATSVFGIAARGAQAGASGFLSLLGGPWGVALLAAAGAIMYVTDQLADEERQIERASESHRRYADYMTETTAILREAGVQTQAWGGATAGAVSPTDQLTTATSALADQTFRLADARRQAAYAAGQQLLADLDTEQRALDTNRSYTRNDRWIRWIPGVEGVSDSLAPGQSPRVRTGSVDASGNEVYRRATYEEASTDIRRRRAEVLGNQIQLTNAPPTAETPSTNSRRDASPPRDDNGGGSNRDQAAELLRRLQGEAEGLRTHTAAVNEGQQALERWRIAEAGRQAVAQAGREATAAQVAAIRAQAEEVERLRIADERITRAREASRTGEREITALRNRAAAAHGTEEELEELARTEAANQAVQALGVDSLDDLTGAQFEAANAAYETAQALEGQRQATDRAMRAGTAERDLTQRIAVEQAHARAIGGVTRATAEWQRSEFVRQEVERAGLRVTDAAAAGIIREANALYTLQAANQGRTAEQALTDELAILRLSTREREVQQRMLVEKSRLMAEHAELSEAEAESRARQTAELEQQAHETAETIGQLRESTRQAFIDSGSLEDFGKSLQDTVQRRLRAAFYDAFLARPLEILINAVIQPTGGGLGGAAGGSAGGLGDLLGGINIPGIGSLSGALGAAGQLYGLWQGGSMIGGSLAKLLGGNERTGSMAGGLLGGLPGALIGALHRDREGDRPLAQADLVLRDGKFVVAGSRQGDKGPIDEITKLAGDVAATINQLAQSLGLNLSKVGDLYTGIGYVKGKDSEHLGQGYFGGRSNQSETLSGFRESTWDAGFHSGYSITNEQDAQKLAAQVVRETILRAVAAGAGELTDAERRLLESTSDLEAAIAKIQLGRSLTEQIDDAIQQLTDPAAYEKKKALDAIEASYQAMKAQAEELVAAGLVSGDILVKLDQLKKLQVDDALKRLAGSAESAADALRSAAPRLREWLDRAVLGDAAPIAPDQQRAAALSQYQRQLALAQGGDAEALGSITEYADRLLAADRESTVDAQARRALFDQIMAEIGALVQPDPIIDPVVVVIDSFRDALMVKAQQIYSQLESSGSTTIDRLTSLVTSTPTGLEAVRLALGLNRTATADDALQVITAIDSNRDGVISASELIRAATEGGLIDVVTALGLGTTATTDLLTQVTGGIDDGNDLTIDWQDRWVQTWGGGLVVTNLPAWQTVFGDPMVSTRDSLLSGLSTMQTVLSAGLGTLTSVTQQGFSSVSGTIDAGLSAVQDSVNAGNDVANEVLAEQRSNNTYNQQIVARLN